MLFLVTSFSIVQEMELRLNLFKYTCVPSKV